MVLPLLLGFAAAAHAATVVLSFDQVVAAGTTTSPAVGLDLKISDTGILGKLQFVIASPTLTGTKGVGEIVLNVPTSIASTISGMAITGNALPNAPASFTAAGNPSKYSATQNVPGGLALPREEASTSI